MEKIVMHPLYIRCKKVLASCDTKEQFETALKYCNLAEAKTDIRLLTDLGNMDDYIAHRRAWSDLRKEARWN